MTASPETPPEERKIGPLVWLSLLTPLIFVIFLLGYEIASPIRLIVANHAEEPLTGVSVEIQEQKLAIPDLAPGQSHGLWFRNQRETGAYTLRAKLGEGKEIEETQGELRSGMLHGFYGPAVFTVQADGSVAFSEN